MKEWQHHATCTIHLDHEQLLLLKGGPGAARTGFFGLIGRRFVAWTAPLRSDGLRPILAAIRRRLPVLERT